ncbi:hypothetical protein Taro_026454 [Colocasia esculenta]|uniref:CCHC-type domain-containing protein n=1 Tax=Colocasia esculenta TaxID=4460 RepID=A0A843VRD2_COLES|nr:hypothetical protein [Colocasia esculenta]
MSQSSRSPPRDRKIRTERFSYRDAPYRRDFRDDQIYAIIASDLDTLQENVPMLLSAITVVFLDCTNEKACNNCRQTGHLARDCPNEPVCNMCNVAGHVARQCPKADMLADRGAAAAAAPFYRGGGGYRDVVCRTCNQVGHTSRECMGPMMICHNCGGRGHLAFECPSGRFMERNFRRY